MSVVDRPGPASTLAAVVRYLLDTPHVSTRVNNHIYGQELNTIQDGVLPKMPAGVVVVVPSGGISSNWYVPVSNQRFDVKCYGKDWIESEDISLAAYHAMKYLDRETPRDTLLFSAQRSGGPLALRDPDADWPYYWQSFEVLASEVYVYGKIE